MKKWINILVLFATIGCFSCKDYLSVSPANIRSVETVEDVRGILGGYLLTVKNPTMGMNYGAENPYQANWYGIYFFPNGDLLRMFYYYDNSVSALAYLSQRAGQEQQSFYWDGMEWQMKWVHEKIWDNAYLSIGFMNNILFELDRVEGNAVEKQRLRGEAKVLRCWHIFKLLQYFASYDDNKLGIPLNMSSEATPDFQGGRLEQTRIYQLILQELDEVLQYEAASVPDYNLFYNETIIHALLAQVYQYKAEGPAKESTDWSNARKHALIAMEGRELAKTSEELNTLFKGNQLGCLTDNPHALLVFFWDGKDNKGIYGDCIMQFGTPRPTIEIDPGLLAMYSDTDIRMQNGVYIYNQETKTVSKYVQLSSSYGIRDIYSMFRVADLHLIIAESYIREGDETNARKWLQDFKDARQAGAWNSDNVLDEILNERQKEFACEYDYRWLDMKRNHMTMTRKYTDTRGEEKTVTLESNDYRYNFYIPETSEISLNKQIQQNPGW